MNYQFLGRLTFKELAARTWRETNEDKILFAVLKPTLTSMAM